MFSYRSLIGALVLAFVATAYALHGGSRVPGSSGSESAAATGTLHNNLANSPSAYLRSAADQPVHWQPWGDEAFALAALLDKPVYLDIGAIWCHWCHVMDRESYENPAIAALINEHFVPIKVDRDLRPDIDQRYQRAVAVLTGASGWPLTAFLTPAGEVVYGATYLPPSQLLVLLPEVAAVYHSEPEKVASATAALREHLRDNVFGGVAGEVSETLVEAAVQTARERFDAEWGGFGEAPKFPQGNALELLLARHVATSDDSLLEMVTTTLDRMATGGIRDQLSGRFHRYSTDKYWRLPHFEIMLYDQAEILSNYLDAFALTGSELYRRVAMEQIAFLTRSFSFAAGGFFANQDADTSLDDDGSYYTWSVDQLNRVVDADEAEVLRHHFDIRDSGEMAVNGEQLDQNVLWIAAEPAVIAPRVGKSLGAVEELLASGRTKLRAARQLRRAPQIDRSLYSDGNGMMVSSFLKAYATLGDEPARDFALRTLDFLLDNTRAADGSMYHAWLDGEARVAGLLDDQVMVARALLDAYATTGETRYLNSARALVAWALDHLWDTDAGGFFDAEPDPDAIGLLSTPRKPVQDAPSASGNGVGAQVLNRLYYLTQDDVYRQRAGETIAAFAGQMPAAGISAAALAIAVQQYVQYPTTVVIVGAGDNPLSRALHTAALGAFRPGKVLIVARPEELDRDRLPEPVAAIVESVDSSRWPLAFVCSAATCAPPTNDVKRLHELIERFELPAAR